MMAYSNTSPLAGDSKLVLYRKWLQVLQAAPGAFVVNNPKAGDTLRITQAKILNYLLGHNAAVTA